MGLGDVGAGGGGGVAGPGRSVLSVSSFLVTWGVCWVATKAQWGQAVK